VIAGLGVGVVSCLVPMYPSECSPKNIRGSTVGLYQLAITIGALLDADILNATKNNDRLQPCRVTDPIAFQFAWGFIHGGGMTLLPESPCCLLHKGRVDKALRPRPPHHPADSPQLDAECSEITLALEEARKIGSGTYAE
ncbi:hypothetical protein B0H13DRAFT_1488579, partial [Mycena leptocephala]